MSPETRFHQTAVSLTIILMFALMKMVNQIPYSSISAISIYLNNIFVQLSLWVIGSVTAYSWISRGLLVLISHIHPVRRILLGPAFIEGTWVGWFKGHSDKTRYLVEIYEQSLSEITMRGYAYDSAGREHSVWNTRTTRLDVKNGIFCYTYTVAVVDDPKVRDGLCEYQLFRSHDYSTPNEMAGYTIDLHDPTRLYIREYKVSNRGLSKSEARAQLMRLIRDDKIPGEGCFIAK